MIHRIRTFALCAAIFAAPLIVGCGKSSPTAPDVEPEPAPQTLLSRVTFDRVLVIKDGDLVGPGEFEFRRELDELRVLTSSVKLGDGESYEFNWTNNRIGPAGKTFTVRFEASEWDKNIYGENVRDGDMSRRSDSRTFTMSPSLNGDYTMTLGNGNCKVRLYYSISTH